MRHHLVRHAIALGHHLAHGLGPRLRAAGEHLDHLALGRTGLGGRRWWSPWRQEQEQEQARLGRCRGAGASFTKELAAGAAGSMGVIGVMGTISTI